VQLFGCAPFFADEVIGEREYSFDVANDVEISTHVGLAQGGLPRGGAKHSAQCFGAVDFPCEARELTPLGGPSCSVPEFDSKVSRVNIAKNRLNKL
jgi:hypothetical protein